MFKIKSTQIIAFISYALVNSFLSFAIIYMINNVISGNDTFLKDYMFIVFFATIVYTYLLNVIFQKELNKYTYDTLCLYEKKLFEKILASPLVVLEKVGTQRFYAAVEDTRLFYALPNVISGMVSSILMVLLCIIYLIILSGYAALIVIGLIIVLVIIYYAVIKMMSKSIAKARVLNEHYFSYVDDAIKGFKELKINPRRKFNMLNNHLYKNRDNAKQIDYNVTLVFLIINLVSQYGMYFIMGAILFLLPAIGLLEREDVIAYVVILLFLGGPTTALVNLQNMISRFVVANKRLKQFFNDFNDDDEVKNNDLRISQSDFLNLEFRNVIFKYENEKLENSFGLGPVSMAINKGELIFIVGGNGSGKSTFINVVTGLYKPLEGEILVNENLVTSSNELKDLISAVFTDNYILSKNYDDYKLEGNTQYHELLQIMALTEVVQDDTEESARRSLSKGQSKRMSLILALLENKPILVLDEWAADQDPHFRRYFYENLLPKLKKQGKTVIAVTHDDAYFKYADRVIKFDYGQIADESTEQNYAFTKS